MSLHLLENIIWHALAGRHALHSVGTDEARRYAPGFAPFIAFADLQRPRLDALTPFCEPGEHFYCAWPAGELADGWAVEAASAVHQLVWELPAPPPRHDTLDLVRLGPAHHAQVLALVDAAPPGPFAPRTTELGAYYGVFEGDTLVAMAGERMAAGTWREISGVATHPAHRGRGLARRLMEHLIRQLLQQGEQPFLHVMDDNVSARRIYERMGFRHVNALPARVLVRQG